MELELSADDLAERWILDAGNWELLANKTGATRLGFAALLKFFEAEGRFSPQARGTRGLWNNWTESPAKNAVLWDERSNGDLRPEYYLAAKWPFSLTGVFELSRVIHIKTHNGCQ
jgi:hypothetical protein